MPPISYDAFRSKISGRTDQYDASREALVNLLSKIKNKIPNDNASQQLLSQIDAFESGLGYLTNRDDENITYIQKRAKQALQNMAGLHALLVSKDGNGKTVFEHMVDYVKEDEDCGTLKARNIVNGHLKNVSDFLQLDLNLQDIRNGKAAPNGEPHTKAWYVQKFNTHKASPNAEQQKAIDGHSFVSRSLNRAFSNLFEISRKRKLTPEEQALDQNLQKYKKIWDKNNIITDPNEVPDDPELRNRAEELKEFETFLKSTAVDGKTAYQCILEHGSEYERKFNKKYDVANNYKSLFDTSLKNFSESMALGFDITAIQNAKGKSQAGLDTEKQQPAAHQPVAPAEKRFFQNDPANPQDEMPADEHSFAAKHWSLRHTEDYDRRNQPLEPMEIPADFAAKEQGLYMKAAVLSQADFEKLDVKEIFGAQNASFDTDPEEVAFTLRKNNDVDYTLLSQRAHQILTADQRTRENGTPRTADDLDPDAFIISAYKVFHEIKRSAPPSERNTTAFKKFAKSAETLLTKATDKDRVKAETEAYKLEHPMPAGIRAARKPGVNFTRAELVRHWEDWIGETGLNLPGQAAREVPAGRKTLTDMGLYFNALRLKYEHDHLSKDDPKYKKVKELADLNSALFANPKYINNAKLQNQFNKAADNLAELDSFLKNDPLGKQITADLPDAIAWQKSENGVNNLSQEGFQANLESINETMRTGLTEELMHIQNLPNGAVGMALLDDYEDNGKTKSYIGALITTLEEKKKTATETQELQSLLTSAKELDKSCKSACNLELQDQLDRMDEIQERAKEFDEKFSAYKKANPGEREFYQDFDKKWRGVKYQARSARYSDKNWERYLEFHGKEYAEGREREYFAKALVAFRHTKENPVIPFSRNLARKEAEVLSRDPVYKYLTEKEPEKLRELMNKGKYAEAVTLVTQPFMTDNPEKLKQAYAGLESMYKAVLEKPGDNAPQKWKDFYNTLGSVVNGYKPDMSPEQMAAELNRVAQAASGFLKGRKSVRKAGSPEERMVDQTLDTLALLGDVSELGKAKVQAEFDRVNEVRGRFYNKHSYVRMADCGLLHAIEQKAALEKADIANRFDHVRALHKVDEKMTMASDITNVEDLPEWNEDRDILPGEMPDGPRETVDVEEKKKLTQIDVTNYHYTRILGETAFRLVTNAVVLSTTPAFKKLVDPDDPSKGYKAVMAKDSYDKRGSDIPVRGPLIGKYSETEHLQKLASENKNLIKEIKTDYDNMMLLRQQQIDKNIDEAKTEAEKQMRQIYKKYGVDPPAPGQQAPELDAPAQNILQ